ncbi:MAG TPA: hypothetical protein VEH07_10235 [Alphaproteobacteria bacterium]|nr:hypothetical protein [Alphaproteobacteria bacterium]
MQEAQRAKKSREALFIMIGIDAIAFIVFWLVQAYVRNPNLAFALLIVGLMIGAAYYIYQANKLRPKE